MCWAIHCLNSNNGTPRTVTSALIRLHQLCTECWCGGDRKPHVQNVAQAEASVRMAKFPPLGDISYPPMALFGKQTWTKPGQTVHDVWNEHAAVFCQIEDVEGVKNVEEVARVPGGAHSLVCFPLGADLTPWQWTL